MLRRLQSLVAALLLVFPLAINAASQQDPGAARAFLRGTVLDPMRASIAGARITAVRDGAAAGPSAVSDQSGRFTLALDPGRYTLTIVAAGFQDAVQSLDVQGANADPREFILPVAGVQEAVTVSAPTSYQAPVISSGTKTPTPLRDVPQSVTIINKALMQDQLMRSVSDVVRYVPGIASHQGENNRDQVVIRGNSSSADFFLDGVRDDVQYYRDLYNLDRVEALKGPNAMIFGRGGGGGVLNRVTKEAGFAPLREFTLLGGSYDARRFATDLDQRLSGTVAFRVNGMYENSNSFRQSVNLERYGINPTLTIAPGSKTKITLGYEYAHDGRVADRGIPSFQGRPIDTDASTYFGDPSASHVRSRVNLASAMIEHQTGRLTIRNRTLVGDYDREYQNFVPGVVSADKTQVSLSAYNNATKRLNVFNQTDATYRTSTGRVQHTLLAGVEIGRQLTDNFRNTGFFNNTSTTLSVPLASTVISTPVVFRQSATDADNDLITNVAATYVQDQVELSRYVQLVGGLRADRFDLQYHNNRDGSALGRVDNLLSPRGGIVFKPVTSLSLYSSYTVSYLPGSGDQFSSLTTITQQVKPERFTNYEAGAKWDVERGLSVTMAAYRLDRTNTRATDPNDPTRIVQTGSQRTNGYELGANGSITRAWSIAGGYAYQDAFVTSATASAAAGAHVAQVPRHTISLWNRYQLVPRVGVGLGVVRRTDMFAAIDDAVTLPGYTEADAAVYASLTSEVRLQANIENVFNTKYFVNADSNTNISPGSPRAIRVALVMKF